jgi:hypothetical protein
VIGSSQRPLPDNAHHSKQTNIYYPGGIRTHNLSILPQTYALGLAATGTGTEYYEADYEFVEHMARTGEKRIKFILCWNEGT